MDVDAVAGEEDAGDAVGHHGGGQVMGLDAVVMEVGSEVAGDFFSFGLGEAEEPGEGVDALESVEAGELAEEGVCD